LVLAGHSCLDCSKACLFQPVNIITPHKNFILIINIYSLLPRKYTILHHSIARILERRSPHFESQCPWLRTGWTDQQHGEATSMRSMLWHGCGTRAQRTIGEVLEPPLLPGPSLCSSTQSNIDHNIHACIHQSCSGAPQTRPRPTKPPTTHQTTPYGSQPMPQLIPTQWNGGGWQHRRVGN
jgi:hypothetical protein